MSVFVTKLKEVLSSVLPITIIVLILNFTLTPLETPLIIRFLIGAVLIIFGLTIFLIGVDIGITPIGNNMGATVARSMEKSINVQSKNTPKIKIAYF